jgi:excisionase family DNA binding protein
VHRLAVFGMRDVEQVAVRSYSNQPENSSSLNTTYSVLPAMSTSAPTLIEELRNRRELLTVNELSALLSAHKMSIYKWVRQGRIPHLRVGSGLRFDPRALAQWLERRTVAA